MSNIKLITHLSLLCSFFSFTMPLIAPWYLLLVFFAIGPIFFEKNDKGYFFYIRIFVVVFLLGCIFKSLIDIPVGIVLTSIFAIKRPSKYISIYVISFLLQSSVISTIEGLVSEVNNIFSVTAPVFITAFFLLFLYPSIWRCILTTCSLIYVCAYIQLNFSVSPALILLTQTIILCISIVIATKFLKETLRLNKILLCPIFIIFIVHWHNNYPHIFQNMYLYLPNEVNSPEYLYFNNYKSILEFSGLTVNDDLSKIKDNSLLIVPWTTETLNFDFLHKMVDKDNIHIDFKALTILYVTEHTNMGETADRFLNLSKIATVNKALSVPIINSDSSGFLRSSDLFAWQPSILFNRGTSLTVNKITDKVLLSGDAWWVEPDIKEWLWVGDYRWTGIERTGRIKLAVSTSSDNINYIVIGDNTPFLNSQIIGNPTGILKFISLSTLWPTFIKDSLILFCISILLFCSRSQPDKKIIMSIFFVLLTHLIFRYQFTYQPSQKWSYFYNGESSFEETNFNKILTQYELIMKSNFLLNRLDLYETIDESSFSKYPEIVFGFVSSNTIIPGITISNCKRIGALQLETGIVLKNSQACTVKGNKVSVIIGTEQSAAAFKFLYKGIPKIIILDRNFLSQQAPKKNAEWLIEELAKWKI